MSHTVQATYSRTKHSVTRALYQYDYGQVLTFDGFELGATYEVHFANRGSDEAVARVGDINGVQIPDECLESGEDIHAWVYIRNQENDGESVYLITIPVMKRAKCAEIPEYPDVPEEPEEPEESDPQNGEG